MTLYLPNLNSQLVTADGRIKQPWNNFFQQFTQQPSGVMDIIVDISPFSYTTKEPGTLVISSGTISQVNLIRGNTTVDMGTSKNIVVMIGDIIEITYSVLPSIQFLPFYGAPRS